MSDNLVPAGEFNAGMKGVANSINALSERVAALETLQHANLQAQISEAKESGKRESDLRHIEKRLDNLTLGLGVLAMGFLGQLLWWGFQRLAAK